jgi:hypothetical protein
VEKRNGWGGARWVEGAFFNGHATALSPLNKIYTGNVTFELKFVYLTYNKIKRKSYES